jgi:hypothetical protein
MGRLLWRDGFDCNAHVVVKMVSSMSENGFNYVSCQATPRTKWRDRGGRRVKIPLVKGRPVPCRAVKPVRGYPGRHPTLAITALRDTDEDKHAFRTQHRHWIDEGEKIFEHLAASRISRLRRRPVPDHDLRPKDDGTYVVEFRGGRRRGACNFNSGN